jgi:hypothetical protein
MRAACRFLAVVCREGTPFVMRRGDRCRFGAPPQTGAVVTAEGLRAVVDPEAREAMSIIGRVTGEVFRRCNVKRDDVQEAALARQQEHLSAQRGTTPQPTALP